MLERSASNLLLSNTSVILLEADDAFILCGAAIRYRPNGSYVACSVCRQALGYRKMIAGETTVKYRCNQMEHPPDISRYKQVHLLKPDHTTTIGGGLNARCRYIVTRSAGLLYECDIHPNPLQICNRYWVTALLCLHIACIYTSLPVTDEVQYLLRAKFGTLFLMAMHAYFQSRVLLCYLVIFLPLCVLIA